MSQLYELTSCLFQVCAVVVSCGSQNSCNIHHAIIYVHIIRDRDFTRVKYGPDYMKKKEIRSTISER